LDTSASGTLDVGRMPVDRPSAAGVRIIAALYGAWLLEDLRSRYDFVIIDSAPVLVISDAQILSSKADETLLVVRWGATRREVATYAARQLKSTARRVGGAILSQVDVTKQARYNYGDSGYYFGKAKRYYTT
jgi:succinoglycan biosynthesis transport protein ExoP